MRLFTLTALVLLVVTTIYLAVSLPDVARLSDHYPWVEYHGDKRPFTVTLNKKRPASWVSYQQVSKRAIGAIVVSEDATFFWHEGYDPDQMRDALKDAWEAGGPVRGASTITQQVSRNVFLSQERTLSRKLKEFWVAIQLEKKFNKRKILETYLNIAEWGRGVFGIEQASQHYFKKSAANLTAKEGAFLAMLLPSPKRYNQSFKKKKLTHYAERTIEDILKKMEMARYISAEERMSEEKVTLSFEAPIEDE